jgi:hypothetical protein
MFQTSLAMFLRRLANLAGKLAMSGTSRVMFQRRLVLLEGNSSCLEGRELCLKGRESCSKHRESCLGVRASPFGVDSLRIPGPRSSLRLEKRVSFLRLRRESPIPVPPAAVPRHRRRSWRRKTLCDLIEQLPGEIESEQKENRVSLALLSFFNPEVRFQLAVSASCRSTPACVPAKAAS